MKAANDVATFRLNDDVGLEEPFLTVGDCLLSLSRVIYASGAQYLLQ